jgi:hypothetical protein
MKYLYHFSIACITQIFALVVSAADPIEARSEEDLKNAIIPSGSDQVITSTATGE